MDDVKTWDPTAARAFGERQVELIRKACRNLDAGEPGLTVGERGELAPLMTADAEVWAARLDAISSDELVGWIRSGG